MSNYATPKIKQNAFLSSALEKLLHNTPHDTRKKFQVT